MSTDGTYSMNFNPKPTDVKKVVKISKKFSTQKHYARKYNP